MSTKKDNRLIAEFLGWKVYNGLNPKWNNSYETFSSNKVIPMVIESHEFKFHMSWDWMIPCIAQLNERLQDSPFKRSLFSELSSLVLISDIGNAYSTLLKGIEYYNKFGSIQI